MIHKSLFQKILFALYLVVTVCPLLELAMHVLPTPARRLGPLIGLGGPLLEIVHGRYDSTLGWIPRSNFATPADQKEGIKITTLEDGIRSNGRITISDTQPVLAVGDSFTFGNQVSDSDTWPSILESLFHKSVLNAGVFGFGIDQSVQRAEALIQKYHPSDVFFSFIEDDIRRVGHSIRDGAAKPYFTLQDDRLTLQNSPVPPPGIGQKIMLYQNFLRPLFSKRYVPAPNEPIGVTCALFRRLAKDEKELGTRVHVVIQSPKSPSLEQVADLKAVRPCLLATNLDVIDLASALATMRVEEPERHQRYFSGHMTPEGNRWVAEQIAMRLPQGR